MTPKISNLGHPKGTTNLGTLFDAGTVRPGQTVSAIKFLAVATNGFNQAIQIGNVTAGANPVACVPSLSSVTPTAAGAPFSVSFTVPPNYPFPGSGGSFQGVDPEGNKKLVEIAYKVQTVTGSTARASFKTTDLKGSSAITLNPINGFTGSVGVSFDRTFQSSDGVPSGYVAVPSGVNVSAASATISGTSAATATANFTWSSWTAGNYAVIAVLTNGTMAIRVPLLITISPGSTTGSVKYSAPISVPNATGATVRCVSPAGKMAGISSSGNLVYWPSPTSSAQPVSATGLGSSAGPVMFAINDSGQMVGNAARGVCYWSSPSANPVYLQLPAGYNGGVALCINNSGQIVGQAVNSGVLSTAQAVYWSSPTAKPVLLSQSFGGGVGSETAATAISNAGIIAGYSTDTSGNQRVLVWNSSTANPTALLPDTTMNFSSLNPTTSSISGWTQVGVTPYVWNPTSYSAKQYAGSGFPNAVGSDGVVAGTSLDLKSASIWTSPTASPVALSSLVQSSGGWTFQQALFMTSAGDVIGQGTLGGSQGVFVVHRQP